MRIPLTYIIIAVLIGIIVFLQECGGKKCPTVSVKTDTVYIRVHDTITQVVPKPVEVIREGKPYPIVQTDTMFLTEIEHVDTSRILADYFATRYYVDTSRTTYGTLFIRDSVTQNKIKFRQIIADWKIPEVHQTAVVNKTQVFGGVDIGSTGTFLGLGGSLMLKTPQDRMYGLGASYLAGQGLYVHGSLLWKIHFSPVKL